MTTHPSVPVSDTVQLAKYWASVYAAELDGDQAPPPTSLAIVGHEADGLMYSERTDDSIRELAWGAAYMAYPCDAVYVSANYRVDSDPAIPAVLNFTHLLPTNETVVVMMAKTDDRWAVKDVTDQLDELFFEPVRQACHDYDELPISDGEPDARRSTREVISQVDDPDCQVAWLPALSLLDAARTHHDRRGK